jgi:iron complex outermembrane receptor protein
MDNGQYHNQGIVNPFNTVDSYINYTVRNHSIFNQTKIRLSATNMLDSHNLQTLSAFGNSAVAGNIAGTCGTAAKPAACVDQFNASTTVSGLDEPSIMAGRSFSVSVTFGFAPKEK